MHNSTPSLKEEIKDIVLSYDDAQQCVETILFSFTQAIERAEPEKREHERDCEHERLKARPEYKCDCGADAVNKAVDNYKQRLLAEVKG